MITIQTVRETVARQNFVVPAGSVIQQAREFTHCYRGLWCSPNGSYFVTVPKADCKPWEPREFSDIPKEMLARAIAARASALDEAYEAVLLMAKGDKATRFDICTLIRQLKERAS